MSYIGKTVTHTIYGKGEVLEDKGDRIYVSFPEFARYAANRYCFDVPKAFENKYLEVLDNKEENSSISNEQETISEKNKYRDMYKKPFWDYLNEDKIRRTGKPYKMDTEAVDAFYLEKHSKNRDFMDWMKSDSAMEEAKKELKMLIESTGGPRIEERTKGYYSALVKLREYLTIRGVI